MQQYMLFDLDGTLLPLDTDTFLDQYVRLITKHFAAEIDPQLFARQLMASSYAMIGNKDGKHTNQAKFFADFFPKVDRHPEELMPKFEHFYREFFAELGKSTQATPIARQLVLQALDMGYKIVLATNPVFPREAVEQRMQWAGIADLPWELVTSYEDTHFCKPNPHYFQEILDRLEAKPEQCVHVGNDMDEDMAAVDVGISVVIADDYLINRHNKPMTGCLFHGSLQQVLDWLKSQVATEAAAGLME